MNVVKCLQDWAVEAGGLPEPPHVSAGFLAKLGVRNDRPPRNNGRASSFGKRGDSSFSPRNDRSDRSGGDRRRSFESSDRPGGSRSSYGGRSSSFGDRSSGTSSYGETSYGARRDGPPRRTFGDRY
jgi:ATP-dependent RNA helicase MSS116